MKLGSTLYGEISGYRYDMLSKVTDILCDNKYDRHIKWVMFMLKKEEDGTYTVDNEWSNISYCDIRRLFRYIGIRVKEICIKVKRRNRRRIYITSDDYEKFILSLRLKGIEAYPNLEE